MSDFDRHFDRALEDELDPPPRDLAARIAGAPDAARSTAAAAVDALEPQVRTGRWRLPLAIALAFSSRFTRTGFGLASFSRSATGSSPSAPSSGFSMAGGSAKRLRPQQSWPPLTA